MQVVDVALIFELRLRDHNVALIIEICDHNNIPFELRRLSKDVRRKTDKMMKVVRLYVNSD